MIRRSGRSPITRQLVRVLRRKFSLDWTGVHGAPHWARVRANGLVIAQHSRASTKVVELFAFVHDSCRVHDGRDRDHGSRGALFVEEIQTSVLGLSDEETGLLAYACRHHSDGTLDAEVTVQTCWDADRLDLGRVGIRPDPARLCTPAARDRGLIAWAYARSLRQPSRPRRR